MDYLNARRKTLDVLSNIHPKGFASLFFFFFFGGRGEEEWLGTSKRRRGGV